MASLELWKEKGRFPTLKEIRNKAKVKQVGGAILLKFIKKRLDEKKRACTKEQVRFLLGSPVSSKEY